MASEAADQAAARLATRKAFGHTYWMLNTVEMFERLAYFGIRAVVPIYIMQATEPGGLHMTALHKGVVYAWWAIFQSWLPMFTGGVADRYGYKRVLAYAISANVVGYLMMAFMHNYYGFFAGILVLATGTAFFKPALQGSIAQNLNKENSSMGWGVFYWVVNIGAMLAPILATLILGKPHSAEGWRNLFLVSAGYTACNLLLLFTFKDVPSGADKDKSLVEVFGTTIENIWPYWFRGGRFYPARNVPGLVLLTASVVLVAFNPSGWSASWLWGISSPGILLGLWFTCWLHGGKFSLQLRLPAFLLIMSCFWMMMYQLWDLHPNFIEDWVDSQGLTKYVPMESWKEYGDRGLLRVPQQIILTFYNSFLIILLIIPISYIVRKMRTLSAMLIGMTVATIGVLVAGLSGSGWILLLGVTFFSLGEMLTGPKKNQYLGLIAPPGKKGLYLGYVNIPIGVGVGIGSLIAGVVYDNYGEKAGLALKELARRPALVARAAQAADWSDSLQKLPELLQIKRAEAFDVACAELGAPADKGAEYLRESFRSDRGQIENLALQYLALHPDYREQMLEGLGAQVEEQARELREQAATLARVANENSQSAPGAAPEAGGLSDSTAVLNTLQAGARGDRDTVDLLYELAENGAGGQDVSVASLVHLLPDALDIERVVAFELVREAMGAEAAPGEELEDADVIDRLWGRFGNEQEVLNNLALEYLAQGTPRVRAAVTSMPYKHPPDESEERIRDIEERLGIGRTKSFAALSAALGADEAEVDAALAELKVVSDRAADRVYVYLAKQPHVRFMAVGRKDWTKDIDLLGRMLEGDETARQYAADHVHERVWYEAVAEAVVSLFTDDDNADKSLAYRLASNHDLIQQVLSKKDWEAAPAQAAELLGLNAFEARTLVATEVNQAARLGTRLLWEQYYPQYKVWIPFAGIGVLAIIALAIFGQMAKRWGDMNA